MNKKPFAATLAIFLTILIIAPSVFLAAPQRAHAIWGVGDVVWDPANYVANYGSWVTTALDVVENALTQINTYTSMLAEKAQWLNTYVLQPLAYILAGNLMKSLTASTISFVIGEANGTGIPQFVIDTKHMIQAVGDSQALAYIEQFDINSNSPFASAISSSLRNDYLLNTSLAGIWADNMCTLEMSSPNVERFLLGDYSQGGAGAWFALTTQDQNNPYTLYQNSQKRLGLLVTDAQSTRISEVSWGAGFMSWCGSIDETSVTTDASSGTGINPGDPCTNADGSPGTIKTPGSTIKASLDKVLGGTQDKLVQMGDIAGDVNSILSDVASIMQTVQFASQILGGSESGGLLGVGETSGDGSTSRLDEFAPTQDAEGNFTTGYMGATNEQVAENAALSPVMTAGSSMSTRVKMYQDGWEIITAETNIASASVTDLMVFCKASAITASKTPLAGTSFIKDSLAQASAAQKILDTEIAPVLAQSIIASSTIAAALAMDALVKEESTNGSTSYAANLVKLQKMPPTSEDAANAKTNSASPLFSSGAGVMDPPSLTVPSSPPSTITDKMKIINVNAKALKKSCDVKTALDDYYASFGGG